MGGLLICIWLIPGFFIAMRARAQGRSFPLFLVLGFIFGPVFGSLILITVGKKLRPDEVQAANARIKVKSVISDSQLCVKCKSNVNLNGPFEGNELVYETQVNSETTIDNISEMEVKTFYVCDNCVKEQLAAEIITGFIVMGVSLVLASPLILLILSEFIRAFYFFHKIEYIISNIPVLSNILQIIFVISALVFVITFITTIMGIIRKLLFKHERAKSYRKYFYAVAKLKTPEYIAKLKKGKKLKSFDV